MRAINKRIVAAACAGAAVFAGHAVAAEAVQMAVSGTVVGLCKFSSPSYEMLFGSLDGSATSDVTKTIPVAYKCTSGTPASSVLIDGVTTGRVVTMALLPTGGGSLPVTMTWTTPATVGSGFAPGTATDISFDLKGTIPFASLNAAPAGRYFSRASLSILP